MLSLSLYNCVFENGSIEASNRLGDCRPRCACRIMGFCVLWRYVITPVWGRGSRVNVSSNFYHLKILLDLFLISNFRRVLNVVCFLLGNSPTAEFYMPTFRNTLFHLPRQVGMKYDRIWEKLEYSYRKMFGSEIAWANRKEKWQVHTYLPMKMGQCSETSAYKIQTPGNYP